jgi:hypothetical protein
VLASEKKVLLEEPKQRSLIEGVVIIMVPHKERRV